MARILVIDDDAGIRNLTRIILENAGHEIIDAEDGESGLRLLEECIPDAILLDIMLPGISGWEVCSIIRGNPELKDIPLATFTVRGEDEDIDQSIKCHADIHFTKPFRNQELLDTVNRLLEKGIQDPTVSAQ